MTKPSIEIKIRNFIAQNPKYKFELSVDNILRAMEAAGYTITPEEAKEAKNISLFGFGNNIGYSVGDSFTSTVKASPMNTSKQEDRAIPKTAESNSDLNSLIKDNWQDIEELCRAFGINLFKEEESIQEWVAKHYVETIEGSKSAIRNMKPLDYVGAFFRDMFKNMSVIQDAAHGTLQPGEKTETFIDTKDRVKVQEERAKTISEADNFEKTYLNTVGKAFDEQKANEFKQTAETYQMAAVYTQQIELLDKALKELNKCAIQSSIASNMNKYSPYPVGPGFGTDGILTVKQYLTEFFGDENLANEYINQIHFNKKGTDISTLTKALNELKSDLQTTLSETLGDKTYDEIKNEYKNSYRDMYGAEDISDDVLKEVMAAKGTAGMVKIAIITAIQILLTKSVNPQIEAGLGAAIADKATKTALENTVKVCAQSLVKRGFSEAEAASLIQLATSAISTAGTITTDAAIGALNTGFSHEHDWKEYWEEEKGAAKYILYGAIISGPVSRALSNSIKSSVGVKLAFKGVKANAAGEKVISASEFMKSMTNKALNVTAEGIGFVTDIGMYGLLDLVTEDVGVADALKGSADMQIKLKILNRILYTLLGGKVAAPNQKIQTEIDKAVEKLTLDSIQIAQLKDKYVLKMAGFKKEFTDTNQLLLTLSSIVARNIDITHITMQDIEQEREANEGNTQKTDTKEEPVKDARALLRKSISEGNLGRNNSGINIPKGRLGAPSAKFAETIEAFRQIVRKNAAKFAKLDKISDNTKFVDECFKLFEQEMDLQGLGLKLSITESSDFGGMAHPDGTIEINLLMEVNGKMIPADHATLVNRIAHELNHILQNKEIAVEFGVEAYIKARAKNTYEEIKNNPEFEGITYEDCVEILTEECGDFINRLSKDNRYSVSSENSLYKEKAAQYRDGVESYTNPQIDEAAYRLNILEIESYERGNAVETEYKKAIEESSKPVDMTRTADGREIVLEDDIMAEVKEPAKKSTRLSNEEIANIRKRIKELGKLEKNGYTVLNSGIIKLLLEKIDYENADTHLANIKYIIENTSSYSPDSIISSAIKRGYFSSQEGAEAFDFVVNNYSFIGKDSKLSEADIIIISLSVKETLNIKHRNITKSLNYRELARLSDEEYSRLINSKFKDSLVYVSENEDINGLLLDISELMKTRGDGLRCEDARKIDQIITEKINEASMSPNEVLEICSHIIKSFDYVDSIIAHIESKAEFNAYCKAYKYLKEQGIEDCSISILDTDDNNIYNAGKIADIWGRQKKFNWDVFVFDKSGRPVRRSKGYSKDKSHNIIKEQVESKSGKIKFNAELVPIKEDRTLIKKSSKAIFDNNGNLIYIETYQQSEGVPNKYDIYREFSDGTKYKIGFAEKNAAGDIMIEKTIIHESGLKTDYNYVESPNGSIFSYTRITDKSGKVISENQYKYKVIDSNHFKTVENGIEYDIQYTQKHVYVTKSTGEKVKVRIGENAKGTPGVLSSDVLPLLKQMPGSFYFDIAKYGLTKIGVEIDEVEKDNAHYKKEEKLIAISKEWSNEIFTLAHEFGHYRSHALNITSDQRLRKTYMKERKALTENQSRYESNAMHYFIDSYTYATESIDGSIEEIIAEINALMYCSNMDPALEMRSQFLQEFFPETFALVSELLRGDNVVIAKGPTTDGTQNKKSGMKLLGIDEPLDMTRTADGREIVLEDDIMADRQGNNIEDTKSKQYLDEALALDKELTEILLDMKLISDKDGKVIHYKPKDILYFLQKLQKVNTKPEVRTNFLELLKEFSVHKEMNGIGGIIYNLAQLKTYSPKQYKKLCESGLLDLIKQGRLNLSIFHNLVETSYISESVLRAAKRVKDAKNYITKIESQTALNNISQFVEPGEVCEFENVLYVNNNGKAQRLKLSRKNFERLFPDLESRIFQQGEVGDCWLVSTLDGFMSSPQGRAHIFSLFEESGEDIIVNLKNTNGAKIIFKNGKIVHSENKQLGLNCDTAPIGLQMIEQAIACCRLGVNHAPRSFFEKMRDLFSLKSAKYVDTELSDFADPSQLMNAAEGGYLKSALWYLTGNDDVQGYTTGTTLLPTKKERKIMQKIIEEYANNPNCIMTFAANDLFGREKEINPTYNIWSRHAYSIKGYNSETQTVIISNPHNTAIEIKVPINELLKHAQCVEYIML